jgi:hypothetical protein
MATKIPGFNADLGLEVVSPVGESLPTLPARHEARLTGEQVRHRLDALFPNASLDRAMRAYASVRPANPDILIPVRFEALVREARDALHARASSSNDPAVVRACGVLDEEIELRNLLMTYRNMLMQA